MAFPREGFATSSAIFCAAFTEGFFIRQALVMDDDTEEREV